MHSVFRRVGVHLGAVSISVRSCVGIWSVWVHVWHAFESLRVVSKSRSALLSFPSWRRLGGHPASKAPSPHGPKPWWHPCCACANKQRLTSTTTRLRRRLPRSVVDIQASDLPHGCVAEERSGVAPPARLQAMRRGEDPNQSSPIVTSHKSPRAPWH